MSGFTVESVTNDTLKDTELIGLDNDDQNKTETIPDDTSSDDNILYYKYVPISKINVGIKIFIFSVCGILLFPFCIVPVTGPLLTYFVILLFISFDILVAIFCCQRNKGNCCQSNKFDVIYTNIVVSVWIFTFIIAILCMFANTVSPNVTYDRWEEFVPIIPVLLILYLLIEKLYLYYKKMDENEYINNSFSCGLICNGICYIIYLLIGIFIFINSIEKSVYINAVDKRGTMILKTVEYGNFEYKCLGTSSPDSADINFMGFGGSGSVLTWYGWYTQFILKEYGNKSISICSYNPQGYGYSSSPVMYDRSIETDVKHLNAMANKIYNNNTKPMHLMCHSRGCLVSIQYKIAYPNRVSSIVFIDGSSDAYEVTKGIDNIFEIPKGSYAITRMTNTIFSLIIPIFLPTKPFEPIFGFLAGTGNHYNPIETLKYYKYRYYQFRHMTWELKKFREYMEDTVNMYENAILKDPNFDMFNHSLNVKCDYGYTSNDLGYNATERALHYKATHIGCGVDRIDNNGIFYADGGIKDFYDMYI